MSNLAMESVGTEWRWGLGEKVLEGDMPFKRIRNYRRKQLRAVGDELCLSWVVAGGIQESHQEWTVVWESSHCSNPAGLLWLVAYFAARLGVVSLCTTKNKSIHFIPPSGRAVAISLCCFIDDGSPSSMKGTGASDGDPSPAESSHPWCPQFVHLLSICSGAQRDSES